MTLDYDEQTGSSQEFEDFLQYRDELDYGWRHLLPKCAHIDMPVGVYCDKSSLIDERYCLIHLAEHMAIGQLDEPNTPPRSYEGCICPCHHGDPVPVGKECVHCDPYMEMNPFDH